VTDKNHKRRIIVDGRAFDSINTAARAFGLSRNTVDSGASLLLLELSPDVRPWRMMDSLDCDGNLCRLAAPHDAGRYVAEAVSRE
jgi:hypothetical protein